MILVRLIVLHKVSPLCFIKGKCRYLTNSQTLILNYVPSQIVHYYGLKGVVYQDKESYHAYISSHFAASLPMLWPNLVCRTFIRSNGTLFLSLSLLRFKFTLFYKILLSISHPKKIPLKQLMLWALSGFTTIWSSLTC